MDAKKKIFLGTKEICNQIAAWQKAFEEMGHEVHSAVHAKNHFYTNSEYSEYTDFMRNLEVIGKLQREPVGALFDLGDELFNIRRMLTSYDIYIFQWGCSILGRLEDLDLLRQLGKTVICVFNGSDIRTNSAYCLYNRMNGLHPMPPFTDQSSVDDTLNAKLRMLRLAEVHANAVFGSPAVMSMGIRPHFALYLPLDASRIPHDIPDNQVPVIIHAPSSPAFKGTDLIAQTMADLRSEGLQFEFRYLTGVPNEQVLVELTKADICVDQLYTQSTSTFSLEALAAGCAVACGNHPETMPFPADIPAVDINPDNVKEHVRRLIIDRSHRLSLAERSREHVLKNHDPQVSASRLLKAVTRAERFDYDYFPDTYLHHFEAPAGTPISDTNRQLSREALKTRPDATPQLIAGMERRGLI